MPRAFWIFVLIFALIACTRQTPAEAPAPGALTGFSLLYAADGQAISGFDPIQEGASIDLSALPTQALSLRANADPETVTRVQFSLGDLTHVDDDAPYTFPGDVDWELSPGQHTLSATPYSAAGVAGETFTRSFTVTQAAPNATSSLLYVVRPQSIAVYNINNGHRLVKTLPLPGFDRIWGAVGHAETRRLYITYHKRSSDNRYSRGMLAYDLVRERVVWQREYRPFVDSPDITPDGRTIYLPSGEASSKGDFWFVIDAANGDVKDTITVHPGSHNTIVGLSGRRVYLGSVRYPYLVVADTSTNDVVKEIGPFRAGVRPFTINGKETLAYVNVSRYLGFEVGSVVSGKRLYVARVPGFRERVTDEPLSVQSHGIALSPDEREVWVADNFNKHLHIFDVTGVPRTAPVYKESLELAGSPNWLAFSRDGRYVYDSTGHVVEAASRRVVAKTASSKIRLQIDFENGLPVRAYSRYGLGYVTN